MVIATWPAGSFDAATRPVRGQGLEQLHADLDVGPIIEVQHDVAAAAVNATGPQAGPNLVQQAAPQSR